MLTFEVTSSEKIERIESVEGQLSFRNLRKMYNLKRSYIAE